MGIVFYNPMSYAAAVHEIITNYHEPPTMAKYIEGPLMMDLPNYPQAVLERTMRIIEREASKG